MLNSPLFVTLTHLEMDCYTFSLNRPISLNYMSSLTATQLASNDIGVQLIFNGENQTRLDPSQQTIYLE